MPSLSMPRVRETGGLSFLEQSCRRSITFRRLADAALEDDCLEGEVRTFVPCGEVVHQGGLVEAAVRTLAAEQLGDLCAARR